MEKLRTVLLVDDDDSVRQSLKLVIERAGFFCFTAENGPEALRTLRLKNVQVVITDHDMPGMDGVDLLKLVATRHPLVCRILLTARRDAEPAVGAVNHGQAFRYLTKPCRAGDLLTALHFAFEVSDHELQMRRLGAELRRANALLAELRRLCPGVVEELEARQPPLVA